MTTYRILSVDIGRFDGVVFNRFSFNEGGTFVVVVADVRIPFFRRLTNVVKGLLLGRPPLLYAIKASVVRGGCHGSILLRRGKRDLHF